MEPGAWSFTTARPWRPAHRSPRRDAAAGRRSAQAEKGVETMSSLLEQVKSLRGKTGAAAVVGLGAAAVWITMLAIIGAIAVAGDGGGGGGGEEVSATGALPGQASGDSDGASGDGS